MGMPEIEQKVLNVKQDALPITYEERKETNLSKEEMADRYQKWHASRKAKSDYDKAFEATRHLLPDWFVFASLIVGIFTLGLVMLKVNPLLDPIRRAVLWLLDLWEDFLKKSVNKKIKKNPPPPPTT